MSIQAQVTRRLCAFLSITLLLCISTPGCTRWAVHPETRAGTILLDTHDGKTWYLQQTQKEGVTVNEWLPITRADAN